MPIYAYRCTACGMHQDAWRRIAERSDSPACRQCGGKTARRITGAAVRVFHPYHTVAFDKDSGGPMLIRTPAEHSAFLRRNGYEEVGNDRSAAPPSAQEHRERQRQARKEIESQPAGEFSFDEATHGAAL